MRRAVLAAKRGAPQAGAELLGARLLAAGPAWPQPAVVTWVPAHARRVLGQPDAGRALAMAVACSFGGVPCRPLLARAPWGRRQAGLDRAGRARDAAKLGLVVRERPCGQVLLVDDVRTTGATLDRAAELLRGAGADEVRAVVLAAALPTQDAR